MSADDSRAVRLAALAAERASVQERLDGLVAQRTSLITAIESSNSDDEHDPEGATLAWEREQLAALADAARQRLVEIDAVVARLESGAGDDCEVCGQPIPPARLAVRPAAVRCVGCA